MAARPTRGGYPPPRCSRRASTCASASTRGRCAAASCPTATRPSRRRSRTWRSNGSTCATAPRSSATGRIWCPLIEELRCRAEIRAKANPKSSTGRLDVFTRVLTDRSHRFDEIAAGYHGKLYLEVVPAHVRDPREDRARAQPGAPDVGRRAPQDDASCSRCTRARRCCTSTRQPLGGARAVARRRAVPEPRRLRRGRRRSSATAPRRTACRSTSPRTARCAGATTGSRCTRRRGGRIVLEPEIFYLLLSAEGVSIPPSYAAEMLAYDPTAGELRTHYAGFFDPGFGYTRERPPRAAAAPRSRSARATSRSWSSTASRSASSPSSGWPRSPTCSTARTSAPTTRAS